MKRRLFRRLLLILLAALCLSYGSEQNTRPPVALIKPVDLHATVPFEQIKPVLLSVPFLPQVPPGVWSQTSNCNPACFVMLHSYLTRSKPSVSQIMEFDDWAWRALGKSHSNYNGVDCGYSSLDLQKYAAHKGLPPAKRFRANLPILIEKLKDGNPCIVSVKKKMDIRESTFHAMLVVGIDRKNIIVHDPGRTAGKYNSYPLKQFLEVWLSADNFLFCIEHQ